mmetsp:Transcript_13080/g.48903  ORF Transcript_13080/g.48903 Transcript_13080/m.48903 type:complete len:322 (+) Transcript_13080:17-982(+)
MRCALQLVHCRPQSSSSPPSAAGSSATGVSTTGSGSGSGVGVGSGAGSSRDSGSGSSNIGSGSGSVSRVWTVASGSGFAKTGSSVSSTGGSSNSTSSSASTGSSSSSSATLIAATSSTRLGRFVSATTTFEAPIDANALAGCLGAEADSRAATSRRSASSKSGNRFLYSAGSASASAAFLFTLARSFFQSPTTSDTRDGAYVRAMNAASGTRFVVHSKSIHASTSPSRKSAANATLFLPFSVALEASAASAAGEETAEHSSSCPDRSPLFAKQALAKSMSPPDIASSPSCFHFSSPAAMSSCSTICRAMFSSPSCTARSNL